MLKQFSVTKEHCLLLPRLGFCWDDRAYLGAPSVDPKRPYGNSDIIADIEEITGISDLVFILKLHQDMSTVLQILVQLGSVEPGIYVSDMYQNWQKVNINIETNTNVDESESLIYRLRKRAEIRRQIGTRKSVQEGKPDRISDLLEEAATELEKQQQFINKVFTIHPNLDLNAEMVKDKNEGTFS